MGPGHHLPPSPTMKPTHLSNAFRRASPLLSYMTRAMTLETIVERKDIGPTNVQTRLASQQSLVPTPPNPMDALWDLIAILDTEIHAGTTDTTKKDRENCKQTNTVGNIFLQKHTKSTKLVNGHTFHWFSKYTPQWWSPTHLIVMHTNYSTTSKKNTNAQLLDLDAAAWVISIPVDNIGLLDSSPANQASTPQPAS